MKLASMGAFDSKKKHEDMFSGPAKEEMVRGR